MLIDFSLLTIFWWDRDFFNFFVWGGVGYAGWRQARFSTLVRDIFLCLATLSILLCCIMLTHQTISFLFIYFTKKNDSSLISQLTKYILTYFSKEKKKRLTIVNWSKVNYFTKLRFRCRFPNCRLTKNVWIVFIHFLCY